MRNLSEGNALSNNYLVLIVKNNKGLYSDNTIKEKNKKTSEDDFGKYFKDSPLLVAEDTFEKTAYTKTIDNKNIWVENNSYTGYEIYKYDNYADAKEAFNYVCETGLYPDTEQYLKSVRKPYYERFKAIINGDIKL